MSRPPCTIPGCPRHIHARGWCKPHYNRWRNTGNPYGINGGPVVAPNAERDRQWGYGLPGNPWAGNRPCPQCDSDRWTMPYNGRWDCPRWVCVARAHHTLFFHPDLLAA